MGKMGKPPEIGKFVKAYRIQKSISLTELAERSGVSKGMLSQVENGSVNPTIATAWKIANALGYTLHELFGEEGKAQEFDVVRKDEAYVFEEDKWQVEDIRVVPSQMAEVLELYWVELKKGAVIESNPHIKGTIEFATVLEGDVEVTSGNTSRKITTGDTARYRADIEHTIKNIAKGNTDLYLVVKFEK